MSVCLQHWGTRDHSGISYTEGKKIRLESSHFGAPKFGDLVQGKYAHVSCGIAAAWLFSAENVQYLWNEARQDQWLLLITNRKLQTRFYLVPKSPPRLTASCFKIRGIFQSPPRKFELLWHRAVSFQQHGFLVSTGVTKILCSAQPQHKETLH